MKRFIFNFIIMSLGAWGIWGLIVPVSLPEDVRKAFLALIAFVVIIFAAAFAWIEYLFDEFRDRDKK